MNDLSNASREALLRWHLENGVDATLARTPTNLLMVQDPTVVVPSEPTRPATAAPEKGPENRSPMPALQPVEEIAADAASIAAACDSLEALHNAILEFEGCTLKRTAMNTVFADGDPAADLMVVGEAPGAEEDRQGLPFVGASGQLLDRMLAAIGRTRDNSYIANILPWRPPGNRKPTNQETVMCLPFIRRHVELAAPKVVILAGGVSASTLLDRTEGITKLRGKWSNLQVGNLTVSAMPTFHPAYLLRQPGAKANAWRDFLAVKLKIDTMD